MTDVKFARHQATKETFQRYLTLINQEREDPFAEHPRLSLMNLKWICTEAIEKGDDLPIDKISRWLGFIQGCLAMRHLVEVDEERDFTRPLFHRAYREEGLLVPEVFERKSDDIS